MKVTKNLENVLFKNKLVVEQGETASDSVPFAVFGRKGIFTLLLRGFPTLKVVFLILLLRSNDILK